MSGATMVVTGIGMVVFSVVLFVVSIVYRKTSGRKIREELSKDYE